MNLKTRHTSSPVAIYLFIIHLVLISSLQAAEDNRREVDITIYDTICHTGENVWLRARLSRPGFLWFRKIIEAADVKFSYRGSIIGETATNESGIASALYESPENPSVIEYIVRFEGNEELAPAEKTGRLYVYDISRPVMLCNIDELLIGAPVKSLFEKEPEKIPPEEGLPISLQMLHQNYNMVYLTDRDTEFYEKFVQWMLFKAIPPGPVLLRDKGLYPLAEKRYKDNIIPRLKFIFQRVRAGVTHSKKDAELFLKYDLRAVVISDRKASSFPDKAEVVSSWEEAAETLNK